MEEKQSQVGRKWREFSPIVLGGNASLTWDGWLGKACVTSISHTLTITIINKTCCGHQFWKVHYNLSCLDRMFLSSPWIILDTINSNSNYWLSIQKYATYIIIYIRDYKTASPGIKGKQRTNWFTCKKTKRQQHQKTTKQPTMIYGFLKVYIWSKCTLNSNFACLLKVIKKKNTWNYEIAWFYLLVNT